MTFRTQDTEARLRDRLAHEEHLRARAEAALEAASRAHYERADELNKARARFRDLERQRLHQVALVVVFGALACWGGVLFVTTGRACVETIQAPLAEDTPGVVTDRYHHEAYVTQTCVNTGRTVTCTPIYHPERWELRVAHDGHERLDLVTEEVWNATAVGDVR